MAWSTPRTWTTGELVTAAHLNQEVRDNLTAAHPLGVDAWTAYTPTLTQSVAVSKTVTYAKYQRVGRLVHATVNLAITSVGTAGNAIVVGLPVAAASSSGIVGSFRYLDTGTTVYSGTCMGTTTTTVELAVSGNPNPFGVSPAVTTASGDSVQIAVTYEAAS